MRGRGHLFLEALPVLVRVRVRNLCTGEGSWCAEAQTEKEHSTHKGDPPGSDPSGGGSILRTGEHRHAKVHRAGRTEAGLWRKGALLELQVAPRGNDRHQHQADYAGGNVEVFLCQVLLLSQRTKKFHFP